MGSPDSKGKAQVVNVSAKTEYACIAVLELALNYGSGEPVTIRAIAETLGKSEDAIKANLYRMRRSIACGRLRSGCWHGIDPIQTQP